MERILAFDGYQIELSNVLDHFEDNARDMYEEITEEILEDCADIAKPVAIWKKLPVEILTKNEVNLGDETFFSRYLVECMDEVDHVYGFLVSIGRELWEHRKNMEDALEQLIFESIMKTCLDDVFGACAEDIVLQLPDKTAIYMDNPGHLDGWDIADQNKLLGLLEDVEGVSEELTVNGEYLFDNSFSMSGIIYAKGKLPANCMLCPKPDCHHRKVPFNRNELVNRLYDSSGRYEN